MDERIAGKPWTWDVPFAAFDAASAPTPTADQAQWLAEALAAYEEFDASRIGVTKAVEWLGCATGTVKDLLKASRLAGARWTPALAWLKEQRIDDALRFFTLLLRRLCDELEQGHDRGIDWISYRWSAEGQPATLPGAVAGRDGRPADHHEHAGP